GAVALCEGGDVHACRLPAMRRAIVPRVCEDLIGTPANLDRLAHATRAQLRMTVAATATAHFTQCDFHQSKNKGPSTPMSCHRGHLPTQSYYATPISTFSALPLAQPHVMQLRSDSLRESDGRTARRLMSPSTRPIGDTPTWRMECANSA